MREKENLVILSNAIRVALTPRGEQFENDPPVSLSLSLASTYYRDMHIATAKLPSSIDARKSVNNSTDYELDL